MTKWYFVRHAQTVANIGLIYNPAGDELTPSGKEECLRAAPFFAKLIESGNINTVFSSPLHRAQETARLLGINNFVLVKDLTDRDMGSFAGKPLGSFREYCLANKLEQHNVSPEGGESRDDVTERAERFIDYIPSGDHVFITHADIIADVVRLVTGKQTSLFVENLGIFLIEDNELLKENWKPWND